MHEVFVINDTRFNVCFFFKANSEAVKGQQSNILWSHLVSIIRPLEEEPRKHLSSAEYLHPHQTSTSFPGIACSKEESLPLL